jgi:hypothetical protein
MEKFWTKFQNKRHEKIIVTDPKGTAICTVPPGGERSICSWGPTFLFARFSKVTYLPDGKVVVDENHDWNREEAWPDAHLIELLNLTKPDQIINIDGEYQVALSGIPTLRPISVNDPLIETEKLTWKLVTRKFPREDDPRYVEKVTKVEQVKEPRGRREMRAIRKAILLVEEVKTREAVDKRFPSIKGPTDEPAS